MNRKGKTTLLAVVLISLIITFATFIVASYKGNTSVFELTDISVECGGYANDAIYGTVVEGDGNLKIGDSVMISKWERMENSENKETFKVFTGDLLKVTYGDKNIKTDKNGYKEIVAIRIETPDDAIREDAASIKTPEYTDEIKKAAEYLASDTGMSADVFTDIKCKYSKKYTSLTQKKKYKNVCLVYFTQKDVEYPLNYIIVMDGDDLSFLETDRKM